MFTGAHPFDPPPAPVPGPNAAMNAHLLARLTQDPLEMGRRAPDLAISRDLEEAIMMCLRRNPVDRHPSMAALEEAIKGTPEGRGVLGEQAGGAIVELTRHLDRRRPVAVSSEVSIA